MKVTDLGFKHILSLGMVKETGQYGIYSFYEWDGIKYFCGPEALESDFDTSLGTYICISPDQQKLIEQTKKGSTKVGSAKGLDKVLSLYETALYLKYDEETNTFLTKFCDGVLTSLNHLKVSTEEASPFRIVKQTKTVFHGFYSPLGKLNDSLKVLGVDTEDLWMTIHPIVLNNNLKGALVGISKNQEYGMDTLDVFTESSEDILTAA